MAYAMTMLSWTVIEYPHKYRAINEYDHVRELIKWGTDYLLSTFDQNASKIDKIYIQVGGAKDKNPNSPNDFTCWERPEDMDYPRPIQSTFSGPDLASEMSAALASSSIIFKDNPSYSNTLINAAQSLFSFARDPHRRRPYSRGTPWIETHYNSSDYFDEYLWGSAWLYFATGNKTYLGLATNPIIARHAMKVKWEKKMSVLSWDNKVPAALMLLTRFEMFLSYEFPYQAMLIEYRQLTRLFMCSYLKPFHLFGWSQGGLIQLKNDGEQPLQYVANAAFLVNLFANYLNSTGVPGWTCGPTFYTLDILRDFASSQINYILGNNPLNLSYVVGFGTKYPTHVHHRGASIPSNGVKSSCKDGFKWRDTNKPNPNTIVGAMVGGPDGHDHFVDSRRDSGSNRPTLAGNAGLVAALVSLTGGGGYGVDPKLMYSNLPSPFI